MFTLGTREHSLEPCAGTAAAAQQQLQSEEHIEPAPVLLAAAARIQTCSDDEEYAVLDLGGDAYCSSSGGSSDYWAAAEDGPRTYQAPRRAAGLIFADHLLIHPRSVVSRRPSCCPFSRSAKSNVHIKEMSCRMLRKWAGGGFQRQQVLILPFLLCRGALILPSIGADDWMFGLGPTTAQLPVSGSAGVPSISAVGTAGEPEGSRDTLGGPTPDQTPQQPPGLAPPPPPARAPCTFANVLPAGGGSSGSSADAGMDSPEGDGAACGLPGPLGSAAAQTISEYFAGAEGLVCESPSWAHTLSETNSAALLLEPGTPASRRSDRRGDSPGEIALQRTGSGRSPASPHQQAADQAHSPAAHAAETTPTADGATALSERPPSPGFAAACAGGSDAPCAAPTVSNALPAAAEGSTARGSAGFAASATPEGPPDLAAGLEEHSIFLNALPIPAPVAASAPALTGQDASSVDGGFGEGLSRRERFRLAVAAAEAERENSAQALPAPPELPPAAAAAAAAGRSADAAASAARGSPEGTPLAATGSLDDIDDVSGSRSHAARLPPHQRSPAPATAESGLREDLPLTASLSAPDVAASSEPDLARLSEPNEATLAEPKQAICSPPDQAADETARSPGQDPGTSPDQATDDTPMLLGSAELLSIAEPPEPRSPGGGVPSSEPPPAVQGRGSLASPGGSQGPSPAAVPITAAPSPFSRVPSDSDRDGSDHHVAGFSGSRDAPRGGASRQARSADGAAAAAAEPDAQRPDVGGVVEEEEEEERAGVITPRQQSTQELIARFSAGAPPVGAQPAPTSPLKFLRSHAGAALTIQRNCSCCEILYSVKCSGPAYMCTSLVICSVCDNMQGENLQACAALQMCLLGAAWCSGMQRALGCARRLARRGFIMARNFALIPAGVQPAQPLERAGGGDSQASPAEPPPRRSPRLTAPTGYLVNLGPPAGRASFAALPRSPLTSGACHGSSSHGCPALKLVSHAPTILHTTSTHLTSEEAHCSGGL